MCTTLVATLAQEAAGDSKILEVLIGAAAVVLSAVFGAVYSSYANKRIQMQLLEKQVELNREVHAQLLRDHQDFEAKQERERRQYEQAQKFHDEVRQRAQGR